MNASFSQWVKTRRSELDLSPAALAERIGCAPVTLYKIEAGERRPSRQMAELLAEHLDIPPEQRAAFLQHARAESPSPLPPPAHTLHLPDQPTPLIGREAEVAAVKKRLLRDDTRLLTLVGPPGIGKTRLAVQVATEAATDFRDGVWFVPLAPVSDAQQVPSAIVAALGLSEIGNVSPFNRLLNNLRARHLLLVLDNCEHVLAAAPLLSDLLAACPLLRLLATSRAPLRLRREKQFPVPPLALPDKAQNLDVEALETFAAIELFVERAQATQPEFALTEENAPMVAAICARLDGLPLAIEILAARVRLLPPLALLEQLDRQFLLTADGMQDAEPRHRTLSAAVEWSYHLLTAEEQAVFRRLSLFAGGFDPEAAAAVAGASLSTLTGLVDKSMVRLNASGRYDLHELLRQYGAVQLEAAGETAETERQHFAYFLEMAEQAAARVYGPEQVARFDQLELEHDNLRAALAWALRAGELEGGLRLAEALEWFWHIRAHWGESLLWCERVFQHDAQLTVQQRARIRYQLGAVTQMVSQAERSEHLLRESLRMAEELEDKRLTAWVSSALGFLRIPSGLLDEARSTLETAEGLFREIDDGWGLNHALIRLSIAEYYSSNYRQTLMYLDEAANRARKAGSTNALAWITLMLSDTELEQGNFERAYFLVRQALDLFKQSGDREGVCNVHYSVGRAAFAVEKYDAAQQAFEDGLLVWRETGYTSGIICLLRSLALVMIEKGDYDRGRERCQQCFRYASQANMQDVAILCLAFAAEIQKRQGCIQPAMRLFGAAEVFSEQLDSLLFGEHHYQQYLTAARDLLSDPELAAAWEEGQRMTLDQAIHYALSEAR